MIEPSILEDYLLPLDMCKLECDGMTRVISYLLKKNDIKHRTMIGKVEDVSTGEAIFPHCWIELDDHTIIDLRLAYWFSSGDDEDESIPHGVFNNHSTHAYTGDTWDAGRPLPFYILDSLTGGLLSKKYVSN